MSFSDKRAQFSKDKKALDPNFKPETNIPANIIMVRSIAAGREKNNEGDEYAVLFFKVDIETEDGIAEKMWKVTSETLADMLEAKGVDIGSSFTVTKKGEGFQTKYEITNVVNKPVATLQGQVQTPPSTTSATNSPSVSPTATPAVPGTVAPESTGSKA